MTESLLRCERLANDIELRFIDETNRYYGDFYRIQIVVVCRLPLRDELLMELFPDENDRRRLRELCGEVAEKSQLLTRMAVAGPDVARVRDQMIRDFLATAGRYLAAADFPAVYLRHRLKERPAQRSYYGI